MGNLSRIRAWTEQLAQQLGERNRARLRLANDWLSFLSALALICFLSADQCHQARIRLAMLGEIQMSALVTGLHTGLYRVDDRILKAMAQVPRQQFLDFAAEGDLYRNVALPLDRKRRVMMAEPFLTAMMLHLLDTHPGDKVLEVGYGTGYESAILSKLGTNVYAIRPLDPEGFDTEKRIPEQMGYDSVHTKFEQPLTAWDSAGPFDAILVKQSMTAPPPHLLRQLAIGGRMVMPTGEPDQSQRVIVYTKHASGRVTRKESLFVTVAPLLQGHEI